MLLVKKKELKKLNPLQNALSKQNKCYLLVMLARAALLYDRLMLKPSAERRRREPPVRDSFPSFSRGQTLSPASKFQSAMHQAGKQRCCYHMWLWPLTIASNHCKWCSIMRQVLSRKSSFPTCQEIPDCPDFCNSRIYLAFQPLKALFTPSHCA